MNLVKWLKALHYMSQRANDFDKLSGSDAYPFRAFYMGKFQHSSFLKSLLIMIIINFQGLNNAMEHLHSKDLI